MTEPTPSDDDAFVREVLAKWRYRFLANGIEPYDMERLESDIDAWDDWCDGFVDVGDEYVTLAEEALDRDDERTAGQHLVRAAMYFHFGSHYWHVDEARRETVHRRSVATFQRGGAYLDPPVERLEAPAPDGSFDLPGLLRVPERGPDGGDGDSPLVVMLPGGDSTKEELDWYGHELLARGVATVAIEGPAQGETGYVQPLVPDYHRFVSAFVDHLEAEPPDGVDVDRLGVYGVSRGGFYAPHSAANDDRFDACVSLSGAFTVGPVSTKGSAMARDHFMWNCDTDSLVVADRITEALTLRDDVERLTCPTLVMTGDEDHVVVPESSARIAAHAPKAEWVLYEGGNHVCNNIPHVVRPRAAEWLRTHLA